MIFTDDNHALRLEVIDLGFFDEDMTFELFGDEGEPDVAGIRRVPDVKAVLDRAFTLLDDPGTNQGHTLHAGYALADLDGKIVESGWRETGGDHHRTTRTLEEGSIGGHQWARPLEDTEWNR